MVRSLCLAALLLAGCSAPFAAVAVEGDAAPAEAAAQPDSGAGGAPDAAASADAGAPDAPPDAFTDAADAGTDDAADEPDAIPVESGPPTYTAHCVPGTPWQQVCVLGDGGTACNGHRWNCTADGGDISSEFSPDIGEYLSMCQEYPGGASTVGYFCCC